MATFTTFPTPTPEADADLAVSRIAGQATLLADVLNELKETAVATTEVQEEALRSVYAPLVEHAKHRIAWQDEILAPIVTAILERLQTTIASTSATLRAVASACPMVIEEVVSLANASAPVTLVAEGPATLATATDAVLPPGGVIEAPPLPPPPASPLPSATPPGVPPPPPSTVATPTTITSLLVPLPPGVPPPPPTPIDVVFAPVLAAFTPPGPAASPILKNWDVMDMRLCVTVDDYIANLTDLGKAARLFYQGVLAIGDVVARILVFFGTGPGVALSAQSNANFKADLNQLADVFRQISKALNQFNGLFVGEHPDQLVGLYFLRAVVRALKSTNAGVWFAAIAQFDLSLEFTQLERLLDYLVEYLHPVIVPTYPEVNELYLRGEITLDHATCLWKLNGIQRNHGLAATHAQRSQMTADEVVQEWYRRRRPMPELVAELRRMGWLEESEVHRYVRSKEFLPPPSDSIRMALRDVFDPNKLGRKEMEAELREQAGLLELFAANGIQPITLRTAEGREITIDVPLAYWISSYEEISPTQFFVMLHRFRRNRLKRYPLPDGKGGTIFPREITMSDGQKLLKEKDYNPIWRNELAASAFLVPGRIDLKRMYSLGVFGPPSYSRGFNSLVMGGYAPFKGPEVELGERFQDLGYAEPDANNLAYAMAKEVEVSATNKTKAREVKAICGSLTVGLIGPEEAEKRLSEAGLSTTDARRHVALCEAEMQLSDAKQAVAGVRRQFLRGEANAEEARRMLTQIGVRPARIAQFLQRWVFQLNRIAREATAQQLCQWLAHKLIDRKTVGDRLQRLHYSKEDADRIVRTCELGEAAKSSKELARLATAQDRARQRTLAALAKAEAARVKEEGKLFDAQMKARSDTNLKQWWKDGLIGVQEIMAILRLRKWTEIDINRWITSNNPNKPK